MINLPKLTDLDVSGKRVIVRADVDLGEEIREGDEVKLATIVPTLEYLIQKQCKIIIIGHRGRPADANLRFAEGFGKARALAGEARRVKLESLSLRKVADMLSDLLKKSVMFIEDLDLTKAKETIEQYNNETIFLLENLRFDPREEANDEGFARQLASLGEIYINEAFSASHRNHASIVALPLQFKYKQSLASYTGKNSVAAGLRFISEVEHLSRVIENPERPLVFLISGIKKDKLEMIEAIKMKADKVLVAGRLPEFLGEEYHDEKVLLARLNPDKEDITMHSIEKFGEEIAKAKTIVLAGVIGKYEDEGHRQGTQKVFEAVANSSSFKVAGGGDTEQAIKLFNLEDKFDWVSVGGGATLEYLAHATLPGIQVLIDSQE